MRRNLRSHGRAGRMPYDYTNASGGEFTFILGKCCIFQLILLYSYVMTVYWCVGRIRGMGRQNTENFMWESSMTRGVNDEAQEG